VTSEERERLRKALVAERDRLAGELGYMEQRLNRSSPDAAGDLSGYSFHLADIGTDTAEREKATQLASVEGRLLIAIDTALARIDSGEYGACESCSGDIGIKRLEAMPSATLCIECKERDERGAGAHA
jgi:DnaK suppressor protein